jgi:hypothetical protein
VWGCWELKEKFQFTALILSQPYALSLADSPSGLSPDRTGTPVLLLELFGRAYHGMILPLLGFVFQPITTLAYAWMVNTRQPIAGINLVSWLLLF